ncbi:Hydroxyethylthiazole kinase [Gammaproteobacteria bacterium]
MQDVARAVYEDLLNIRSKAPLVHNITNFVVMQSTANALLALGASPIMAHAEEELSDIINIAQSLVVNIGTLDLAWINAMRKAMQLAVLRKIPIILDPVGAGATRFRTKTVHQLIQQVSPTVIRGNASEIFSLIAVGSTKGVDSVLSSEQSIDVASKLVAAYNCVVVISGATDICLAANAKLSIKNGSALMTRVTGMGCIATALIAAFCAINSDAFAAATHAMIVNGIAGEIAATKANGPGSFQPIFYDTLYNLTEKDILEKIDIE